MFSQYYLHFLICFNFNIVDVPGRPESLRIVDKKDTSIELRWAPPRTNGGRKIIGYVVEHQAENTDIWIACNRYRNYLEKVNLFFLGSLEATHYM